MKKIIYLFVMLFAMATVTSCTSLLTEEEEAQIERQELQQGTDPDDDGTVDPDPEETGSEG